MFDERIAVVRDDADSAVAQALLAAARGEPVQSQEAGGARALRSDADANSGAQRPRRSEIPRPVA